MQLRPYQQEAIDAIYEYLRKRAGNPCAVLPTGAGKTPVIATLCRDAVVQWDGRVLVLAHVKELLEQSADKLRAVCPTVPVGVYSAGLKRRDTRQPVIVAGIQSVHDKADQLGRFDLVLIDEAHLIPPTGDGMYRKLIADLLEVNPDLRVIGLTATAFRTGSGPICTPDGILNEVCYEVGVKQLIAQGYLSPLVGRAAVAPVDTRGLKVERGEFAEAAAEALFTAGDEVERAVAEVVAKTADRRSVLLFCQTIAHARKVADAIRAAVGQAPDAGRAADLFTGGDTGPALVGEIYGDTPDDDRAGLIAEFRAGRLKYLVTVNVLTTGFDAPNVDAVCLLRATVSPGLYYQMVGRGFRLAEGKANCLVLDFGQNIVRHGPVDAVKPSYKAATARDAPRGKECPQCRLVAAASAAVCLECGYTWDRDEKPAPHAGEAADEEPVSGKPKVETLEVLATTYAPHTKKGADDTAPKTLRVTYQVGYQEWVSEWVCVEHSGWAADKARRWWQTRCKYPMPTTALEAAVAAEHGLLAEPRTITVKRTAGKPFPEVTGYDLGPVPVRPRPCPGCGAGNLRVIVRSDDPRSPGNVVCGQCAHWFGRATAAHVARYGFISDPGRTHFGGLLPWEFPDAPAADDTPRCPECESDDLYDHGGGARSCNACGCQIMPETASRRSYDDDIPF